MTDPTPLEIRRAEVADAEVIGDIHVRSWQATYQGLMPAGFLAGLDPARRAQQWHTRLQTVDWPRAGVLVVVGDGRVRGFASFGPCRDPDLDSAVTGELAAIYLPPEHWGSGTGRMLMGAVLTELAAAGYARAALWVHESNERARLFYAAAGWEPDGATKRDDSPGFEIPEVRYQRGLPT